MKYVRMIPAVVIAVMILFAGCATEPEEEVTLDVAIEKEGIVYISPENSEGVKDYLQFTINADTSEKAKVQGYRFAVWGENEYRVYEEVVRAEEASSVTLPERFIWEGKYNYNTFVSEGIYTYVFEAWTSQDVRAVTDEHVVVIENTEPQISVDLPHTIFSPNGDGNKDLLIIEQDGSKEPKWTGVIKNEQGKTVKQHQWKKAKPRDLSWNGTNEQGRPVADGEYSYMVSAEDRAGNRVERTVTGIRKDTTETPVTLTKAYNAFSPNGDGNKDTFPLNVEAALYKSVASWQLIVKSEAGNTVLGKEGSGTLPKKIELEGKNNRGETLDEGTYTASVNVTYTNGNRSTGKVQSFVVDLTPPDATVEAKPDIFSPNGDGNQEYVMITQESSKEQQWKGVVTDSEGNAVKTYSWTGKAASQFRWTGKNDKGNPAEDGMYTYVLTAVDKAGNRGKSNKVQFEKDTSEIPAVALKPQVEYFSPNQDGTRDVLTLAPEVETTEGLETYTLQVFNKSGETVYRKEGRAPIPRTFRWKGENNDGERVPNDKYSAKLTLRYDNGNVPTVTTETFTVDKTAPSITVSAKYKLFSPNGDGNREKVTIKQDSSKEQVWKAQIIAATDGEVVYNTYWNGYAEDFSWSGKNNKGNTVQDGTYTYKVSATDRAGNSTSAVIKNIEVDTAPTPIHIKTEKSGFSPNGDGKQDQMTFNLFVDVQEGITKWTVSVYRIETEEVVKSYVDESGNEVPETITWNGKTENTEAETAPDGEYRARLSVKYRKGNHPTAETEQPFVIDTKSPEISVSIKPKPFSPDGDGYADTVTIDADIQDGNKVDAWSLRILDPKGNNFITFKGKKLPFDSITWNGKAKDGELVQAASDYTAKFRAADQYGNVIVVERTVPVDVFVVREDGKLKIKISSIHFEPWTANFRDLENEAQVEKNMETLDRLAEILKKYGDYEITIEGYAVQIYWWDEEEAAEEQKEVLIPLSRKRAEAVKSALVKRGIAAERISTVGLGGKDPVVPHGDLENRWKNRRVEFILTERKTE